jgi:ABC-type nitrate/sulfonate/bicarbonate transport system substrate-binding protein
MAKALASGEVDFTGNAMSNFLPAVEQDLPMIAIGVSVGDGTRKMGDQHLTITAREGSGIKTIQDLAGKKIAYNGAGTTDEYIRAVLARANMKVDDVQLFNVNPGNTANAIQAGQVDAAVLQEPYGTVILETVPGAYLVQRGGDYLAYFSFLTTRPDLLQKDPDLVQKYYDGWAEAAQYVRQHTDEAALIATHWLQGLDQKVAARAIPFQGYDPRVTTTVLESMEDQKKTLVEQKKIKGTVDINKSMDLRFMRSTLQNFPQYFSDLKATQIPG